MRSFVGITASFILAALLAGCAATPPAEPPEEIRQAEPQPAAPVLMDAEVAAKDGDYERAIGILDDILSRNPNDIEAMRLLARVYAASGDRHSSTEAWHRVAALDPYDPDAAYEVGSALARKGSWEQLRTRMLSLESAGAADGRHYLLIGRAGIELGYKTEARGYLEKAGRIELALTLLGTLHYEKGNLSGAEEAFLEALEINGSNFSANLHLGYINFHRGRIGSSIEYYRKAHLSDKTDPLACLSLASACEKKGRKGDAIKYYVKGLKLKGIEKSERKKVYITTARLMVETGRHVELETLVRAGLSEFPSSGGLYFYWGESLLKQGKKAEAKDRFNKASGDTQWKKAALSRFHSIR
jgi:tetratricopeptide (TPR) repeat protein